MIVGGFSNTLSELTGPKLGPKGVRSKPRQQGKGKETPPNLFNPYGSRDHSWWQGKVREDSLLLPLDLWFIQQMTYSRLKKNKNLSCTEMNFLSSLY